MPTKDQPLTQAQFDKSMDRLLVILEKKADKDDVEKIVQRIVDENMILVANAFEKVATKEDLKNYPTKADLEERLEEKITEALAPYATKEDMQGIITSAIERFESSVFATLRNHENRIAKLERA
ncbi:MAG: hypothetical protein AAB649_00330 [Patescibacteria group bacterium]